MESTTTGAESRRRRIEYVTVAVAAAVVVVVIAVATGGGSPPRGSSAATPRAAGVAPSSNARPGRLPVGGGTAGSPTDGASGGSSSGGASGGEQSTSGAPDDPTGTASTTSPTSVRQSTPTTATPQTVTTVLTPPTIEPSIQQAYDQAYSDECTSIWSIAGPDGVLVDADDPDAREFMLEDCTSLIDTTQAFYAYDVADARATGNEDAYWNLDVLMYGWRLRNTKGDQIWTSPLSPKP